MTQAKNQGSEVITMAYIKKIISYLNISKLREIKENQCYLFNFKKEKFSYFYLKLFGGFLINIFQL